MYCKTFYANFRRVILLKISPFLLINHGDKELFPYKKTLNRIVSELNSIEHNTYKMSNAPQLYVFRNICIIIQIVIVLKKQEVLFPETYCAPLKGYYYFLMCIN